LLLIGQVARELGLPDATIATAYRDAPGIAQRRREMREKFRRRNARVRYDT
jgi:hypothetical protein